MNKLNFYESERDNDDKIYFCFAENSKAIWHYHHSLEIVAVLDGSFEIIVSHNAYKAQKGDIYFIPPFCHHSIKRGSSQSVTIVVPPNFLGDYYSIFQKHHCDFLLDDKEFNQNEIFPLLQQTKKFNNQLTQRGMFNMVLGIIAEHYPSTQEIQPQTDFIAQTVGYLQNKYTEKISLSEISSHLGFSKYYFSKLFNSYMKCSFESYLTSIRLTKFIEQLKPDTNITKLAFDCGFESISSFYRNFKSTLGTTPRQMQKMLSQNNGKS